jgi:cell division protein FtsW (lipid II flippase)
LNSNNNNKQFFINQLVWIGISFGIILIISLLLPFPISVVAIFGIFILSNVYRRLMMKRMSGTSGAGRIFGSTPWIFNSSSNSNNNASSLKYYYYCISCGAQHKEAECPECGSKMKKVKF